VSARNQAEAAVAMCRRLARCSETPDQTTRTFLSEPMRDVHATLAAWMQRAGMTTYVDNAGNLRGVYAGARADAPTLYVGSHLDTVPNAGAFDGVLGVVLGVSLIEMLDRAALPFHVEVVGFSEEEGVRFGVPFIGSRALSGTIDTALLERVDRAGISVRDAIRAFELDPAGLANARATKALGCFELHIEQGPVLERLGIPVGCVTAIAGQTRAHVSFAGHAGHAGTTPMRDRHDALAGAAEWLLAVEHEARATPGLVATVGAVEVSPGASNVIAGRCRASIDVRHEDDVVREKAVASLRERAAVIAERRGLTANWCAGMDQSAVRLDDRLVSLVAAAIHETGVPVHRLASGAGHDAMIVATCMPAAMLFVRSPGGISHHPDETVMVEDVAVALEVSRRFVDLLARSVA
jgi:allantoate deiminase